MQIKTSLIITLFIVFTSTLLSQNYYLENFTTDPGFDSNSDYHYWDAVAGNFKFTVNSDLMETYASSPEFPSVDVQKNFTIQMDLHAELFVAGEYLTPSIGFSETPVIYNSLFELQLSTFTDELFRLQLKTPLEDILSSEVRFYEKMWYTVQLDYLAADSSLSVMVWKKGNPEYLVWETESKIEFAENFSYLVLGREKKIEEYGATMVSIDSVLIYEEYITSTFKNTTELNPIICYPNPAQNFCVIYAKNGLKGICKLELFNPLGEVVLQKTIRSANTSVNLEALSEGVYFITLTDANGKCLKTQKMMIKR